MEMWPNQEDEFVTIDEFPFFEQLEVVRGMLEGAGIECFCPDSQTSRIYAGGIRSRLQVRKSQLDEARALLDSFESAQDGSEQLD